MKKSTLIDRILWKRRFSKFDGLCIGAQASSFLFNLFHNGIGCRCGIV